MKHYGIFYRLIASPFVFLLALIAGLTSSFVTTFYFIRFGGEWKTYKSKEEKESISDIFELLQNQYNKK